MIYRLKKARLVVKVAEEEVVADIPPWDDHGWTHFGVPVEIYNEGLDILAGPVHSGMYWGSAKDFQDFQGGKPIDPAEAAAITIEEIISAYLDPDEFAEMCTMGGSLSAAELRSLADTLDVADEYGPRLWAEFADEDDFFPRDEDLVNLVRERGG